MKDSGPAATAFSNPFPLTGRDFGFQGTPSPLTARPRRVLGLCTALSLSAVLCMGGGGARTARVTGHLALVSVWEEGNHPFTSRSGSSQFLFR